MLTSTPKQVCNQLYLFPHDREITKARAATVHVGDFFEELTAKLVNGVRYRTDGNADICPDVRGHDRWYESKGIGNTGSTIIYKCRLLKDLQFVEQHRTPLSYVFWRHSCHACSHVSLNAMRADLASTIKHVVFIDVFDLEQLVAGKPTKLLNNCKKTKTGHKIGWAQYGVGWSFSYSELIEATDHMESIMLIDAYGHEVSNVPVYRRC